MLKKRLKKDNNKKESDFKRKGHKKDNSENANEGKDKNKGNDNDNDKDKDN